MPQNQTARASARTGNGTAPSASAATATATTRRWSRARAAILATSASGLIGLAVWACSGSSSSSGTLGSLDGGDAGADGALTTTNDQACADIAHAYCQKVATCSVNGIASNYGTEDTCEARRKQTCLGGLAAPGAGGTASTVEACVQAYATFSCPDFYNDNPPDPCLAQHGTVASGGACAFNGQCQSGFCRTPRGASCGTCGDAPKPGDSCADLAGCGTGLHCTRYSRVCLPFGANSAACDDDDTCGYGLACVGFDTKGATQGTCSPAASTVGAACDRKTGPACDPKRGLFCGPGKTCATLAVAASGQPCGPVNPATICSGGAACNVPADSDASVGTCTGPAADEAPCDTSGSNPCLAPAQCVGTVVDGGVIGTCKLPNAATCP